MLSDDDVRDDDDDKKEGLQGPRSRKRKRLDPEIEESQDPILILNKEFEEDQLGSSQCHYFLI